MFDGESHEYKEPLDWSNAAVRGIMTVRGATPAAALSPDGDGESGRLSGDQAALAGEILKQKGNFRPSLGADQWDEHQKQALVVQKRLS